MRGGRCSLRLLFSLGMFATVAAQPADVAGTMPEDYFPALKTILQNAWNRSPEKIERELEIAQQEARSYGLNSQRLPNVTAWSDMARNQSAVSGASQSQSTDSGLFYRLELTQSIFRWGELQSRSAIARLSVLMAEKSYAESWRTMAVALRQSYLQLVVKRTALKQARLARQVAADELAVARGRLERGGAAQAEVGGRELNLSEQTVALENTEADFAAARRVFARFAGLKNLEEEEIPDAIPKPAYSAALTTSLLAGLLRDGGRFSFEAEINALRAEEADLNYRIARVRLLPKFDGVASYGLTNLANATNSGVTQTGITTQTVALRVSWSIFDGFATRGEKRQALAARQLYRNRTATASEAALAEAQDLGRKAGFDARMLEFGEIRLQLAIAAERRMEEDRQRGKASQSTIEAVRLQRYQAEVNNAAARANFFGTWSAFVSRAGLDPMLKNLPFRHVRENR
ncbi:MAG: hypothetical protein RIQ93_1757 [Verrucomicrobiota bacterium]|jgi:outer membrane protein TolC